MNLSIFGTVCLAVLITLAGSCAPSGTQGSSSPRTKTSVSLATPKDTYKTRMDALRNHDYDALRQTYMAGYLKLNKDVLPEDRGLVDYLRKQIKDQGGNLEVSECFSEAVEGSRARLRYKYPTEPFR